MKIVVLYWTWLFLFVDEIFSVTTQTIQQDDIEHEEEVEQQTVCIEEEGAIEEEEEEEDDGVFTLELTDDSDCEDKEYLGLF